MAAPPAVPIDPPPDDDACELPEPVVPPPPPAAFEEVVEPDDGSTVNAVPSQAPMEAASVHEATTRASQRGEARIVSYDTIEVVEPTTLRSSLAAREPISSNRLLGRSDSARDEL